MGKTTLAVDIICARLFKQVRRCFAVCPTFWQQPSLEPLRRVKGAFTKKSVFTHVSDQIFDALFKVMDSDHVPTLLFVDDAAAEASTNKGNKGSFARLCIAAPHLNLTIIGCFQRLTSCSPAFRDNCECLISFIPSKVIDVDTLCKEFNPVPTHALRDTVVKRALEYAWTHARFCFIYREAFTGRVYYYCGLNSVINFTAK